MGIINLLEETIGKLNDYGKDPSDVLWVEVKGGWCTWDQFAAISSFEYDDGFCGQQIYEALKIVGHDWYLARDEYDGAEWWSFYRVPDRPENQVVVVLKDIMEN